MVRILNFTILRVWGENCYFWGYWPFTVFCLCVCVGGGGGGGRLRRGWGGGGGGCGGVGRGYLQNGFVFGSIKILSISGGIVRIGVSTFC